jgi:uncharacterized membrane protein
MSGAREAGAPVRLSFMARALALLGATGLSLGFALGIAITRLSVTRYFKENFLPTGDRHKLLLCMLGGAGLATLVGLGYRLVRRRRRESSAKLLHAARRLAPLSLVGFLALLFRCEVWKGHDLAFLAFVMAFGLAAHASFVSALRAGAFAWEVRLYARLFRVRETVRYALPRFYRALPFTLVLIGVVGYAVYFGYYTYCFYYSLRSGYDLGIYDSLLWNMLHGGSFYKTPPWVGPGRSHFGNHAEFFAYALLPFYAIRQNGGTLVLIQSAFLGAAAIPLYKLARKYVDRWPAAILALSYLFYPALHGENLFEFHFLPFGPFLLWWAWYFLECRRDRWAALFVLLTLSCREDVSSWVAVLGAYFLFTGRRPKAGLLLAVVGSVWCFGLKFVAMPLVGGGESFTDIYKDLLPQGSHSFGGVIRTLLANPAYTMSTLAETPKLIYMLQILVPLAFLPLRRPIWLVLAIPGFFFSVLSTRYEPLISIHFQYSAHWIAFFFPGVAIALDWMGRKPAAQDGPLARVTHRRRAALFAMVCMALPMSYQYGAILQQTNAYGGIIKFKFGVDAEGRKRNQAATRLVKQLPPRAKVSGSGFTTPFISNRPDAYNITLGIFDAEYLFFPSESSDFIVDERSTIKGLLDSGEFGVVDIEPPFALAKRGHPTDRNAELTRRW